MREGIRTVGLVPEEFTRPQVDVLPERAGVQAGSGQGMNGIRRRLGHASNG